MTTNQIIWHQLVNESPADRDIRLNKDLHRIFFDGKEICPDAFLLGDGDGGIICRLCDRCISNRKHSAPRFLESLDAMQLIVESGKFAEVREEYFHWVFKEKYECTIFLYGQIGSGVYFRGKGKSRQEAFYCAALKSQGFEVVQESQGESNG